MIWRELFHVAPQARQLALEEVLINSVAKKEAPPSFRFLFFKPPSVLVGFHQCVEQEVNVAAVRKLRWQIGRRPTGGGTIVMGPDQLGWEAYYRLDEGLPTHPLEAMQAWAGAVSKGLREIGLNANFRPKNDIEVNGRKISGLGAFTVGEGVSVVGTVIMDMNVSQMLEVTKISAEKISDKAIQSMEERVTSLRRELGHFISARVVMEKIREGIMDTFKIQFRKGELNNTEKKMLPELQKRYASRRWIYGERAALKGSGFGEAVLKTPGGLIRAQTKMDRGILQHVLITGDFFAQPSRSILDLEARLKWIRAEAQEIRDTVTSFFNETKPVIPGVTPDDFSSVVVSAVESAKPR